MTAVSPATDLLIMWLADELNAGRDLGEYVPMLIARIKAETSAVQALVARNTALAEEFDRESSDLMEEIERLRAAMSGTADCAAETAEVCGDTDEFRTALLTASDRLRKAVNP